MQSETFDVAANSGIVVKLVESTGAGGESTSTPSASTEANPHQTTAKTNGADQAVAPILAIAAISLANLIF